jgi:hypothetical protein
MTGHVLTEQIIANVIEKERERTKAQCFQVIRVIVAEK